MKCPFTAPQLVLLSDLGPSKPPFFEPKLGSSELPGAATLLSQGGETETDPLAVVASQPRSVRGHLTHKAFAQTGTCAHTYTHTLIAENVTSDPASANAETS